MGELEDLKDRLKSLATAKSRYQLMVNIISELIEIRGLDNIINYMIHTIMDTWGGSNVIFYYRSNDRYYKSDIYGEKKVLDTLDDPQVLKSWETGEFLEISQEQVIPVYKDQIGFLGDQMSWTFPLSHNNGVFCLIRIEGIIMAHIKDVRENLDLIMRYFAIVFKNELFTSERLKEADLALQHQMAERMEEQIRYIKLIESSFDGFWVADQKGRFLEVNDMYCRMSGYPRQELLTMTIPQVEALETADEIKIRMAQLKKAGRGRFETRHKCRDGSLIDLEINCVYSDSSGGRFYAFLRDNTEKNQLQEQYFQSQKVESIGRLAGGVAHDLNNLLTPILGYSELMKSEIDSDNGDFDFQDYVQEILDAGIRAKDLVNQLLVFSRKQSLKIGLINLNQVIEGFKKLLRRTIREDITFQINLHPGLGCIKADLRQIEQVLMNLSVNAQDSMPRGGILTLETDQLELREETHSRSVPPGSYILLRVKDNGSGMDGETKKHIFEPFFSTKGELGTGLGLATVYGIITQHRGAIEVESRLEKGTEFTLYFPRFTGEINNDKKNLPLRDYKDQQGTILLVEDNAQVLNLTREILVSKGYRIFTAENGLAGLEMLKIHSDSVDLLLTDVVMPQLNGKKLYEKALELNPALKVLFMSGYNDESLFSSSPVDRELPCIRKPFTVDELISKVIKALE